MPVTGYVELTFMFEREGNKWVGTCLELGTSTYDRTLERVEESLHQLVTEHLNLLEEAQERERFFQKHGIVYREVKPRTRKQHHILIPALHKGSPRRQFFQPSIFRVPSTSRRVVATNRSGRRLAAAAG